VQCSSQCEHTAICSPWTPYKEENATVKGEFWKGVRILSNTFLPEKILFILGHNLRNIYTTKLNSALRNFIAYILFIIQQSLAQFWPSKWGLSQAFLGHKLGHNTKQGLFSTSPLEDKRTWR